MLSLKETINLSLAILVILAAVSAVSLLSDKPIEIKNANDNPQAQKKPTLFFGNVKDYQPKRCPDYSEIKIQPVENPQPTSDGSEPVESVQKTSDNTDNQETSNGQTLFISLEEIFNEVNRLVIELKAKEANAQGESCSTCESGDEIEPTDLPEPILASICATILTAPGGSVACSCHSPCCCCCGPGCSCKCSPCCCVCCPACCGQ